VGVATALILLWPTQAMAAAPDSPTTGARGAEAHRVLDRPGHGRAVVEALGDRLPEAATTSGLSATHLRAILSEDPTAWVGVDGHLFYVEEAESLDEVATGFASAESVATSTYPSSETFQLHSLPGSTHKIYLDFNGETVSGTWWNVSQGMPSRFYTGFTLDGDPSTFTSTELAFIQKVWRIVSEKYAAFDVDVTTADPGASGYNRSGSSDQTYGDHVIITDDAGAVSSACSGTCSGVALLGTFDDYSRSDSYYEPAWVFSSKTWDSPALTAHTVAHEVGHTFGLNHDGTTGGLAYFGGLGNWFPIMGTGTNGVGQFSKGEYALANNTEDDLAVIAAGGAPLRADDHGNSTGTATSLGAFTSYAVDGVISTRTDQDVVAITHDCTTGITATATGIGEGASLDISLAVLGPDGSVLGYNNPPSGQTTAWPAVPTGMNATVTVAAGIGTYYVRVDGVGAGSYSDYASIGDYHLAITGCGGATPPPTTTTTTTTTTAVKAPLAPGIRLATSGRRGGTVTATARWAAPASAGGSAITGYRVKALLISSFGRVVKVYASRMLYPSIRAAKLRLSRGHYRFRVIAYNRVGASPASAASRIVTAR
jgi:hypothetical protein